MNLLQHGLDPPPTQQKNIHTLDSVAKSFSLTREDAMCLLPGVVIPQVAPCTVIGAKLQKVIFESLPESNPHFPLPGISIADAMAHGVSWTQAHTKNADEVVLTSVEPCTPVVLWVKVSVIPKPYARLA